MAGVGMIVGEALQGWGEAKMTELKAQREAKLEALREQKADKRAADDRAFRSAEAEIGRKFESGENQKNRDFQGGEGEKDRNYRSTEAKTERDWRSSESDEERAHQSDEKMLDRDQTATENAKTRAASADIIRGSDGVDYVREGDVLKPLTDKDGKQVKVASTATDKPAEVATAEWLVQNGVAGDAAAAWKLVRSARSDPEKSRAAIYKAWLAVLKPEWGTKADPAAIEEAARTNTEKTMKYLEEEDTDPMARPGMGGGSTAPAGDAGPKKGESTEDFIKRQQKRTASPAEAPSGDGAPVAAPKNPADRTVGTVYMTPKGPLKWEGGGWSRPAE